MAEKEAQRLGTTSGGAASLRRIYGNQFRSLGNALMAAGLSDLAGLRFREACASSPATRNCARGPGKPPTPAAWETRQKLRRLRRKRPMRTGPQRSREPVFSGNQRPFHQGLTHLTRLLEVDKQGARSPACRMIFANERKSNGTAANGRTARLTYQSFPSSIPRIRWRRERAKSPVPAEPGPSLEEHVQAAKPRAQEGRRRDAEESPRDRVRAAHAANEGKEARRRVT